MAALKAKGLDVAEDRNASLAFLLSHRQFFCNYNHSVGSAVKVLQFLLEHGVRIDQTDFPDGKTVLETLYGKSEKDGTPKGVPTETLATSQVSHIEKITRGDKYGKGIVYAYMTVEHPVLSIFLALIKSGSFPFDEIFLSPYGLRPVFNQTQTYCDGRGVYGEGCRHNRDPECQKDGTHSDDIAEAFLEAAHAQKNLPENVGVIDMI